MSARGNEHVNGCSILHQTKRHRKMYNTYDDIVPNTKIIPENAWVKCIDKNVSFFVRASMTFCTVKVFW